MKHIVCTLLLLFALSTVTDAAPRHRSKHRQQTEQLDTAPQHPVDEAADEGITAYSDTLPADTGAMGIDIDDAASGQHVSLTMDPASFGDPFSWFGALWTLGTGGVMLGICIMVVLLLIFVLPIVLLIVLVRYLTRRHSDNLRYRQAAIEAGMQPETDEKLTDFDERTWRKGVSTAAVGAGMVVMAFCWSSSVLTGVGFLILFIGLGQMYIGRHTKRRGFGPKRPTGTDPNPNQNL